MSKGKHTVNTLASAILAVGLVSVAASSMAAPAAQPATSEKCFGIAKKGMNDCASVKHSCEGTSTAAGDPEDFIYVLEGSCQKIVGGTKK